jgi:hypothetical protein
MAKKSSTKTPKMTMTYAILALALNAVIIPGLGTFAVGIKRKGIRQMVVYGVGWLLMVLGMIGLFTGTNWLVLFLVVGWIVMILGWIWALMTGIQLVKVSKH